MKQSRIPGFGAYVRFLYLVDGQVNKVSTWMEQCSCHGWESPKCPLKGRRCAELANGEFMSFLNQSLEQMKVAFIACASTLKNEQQRANLHSEFRVATEIFMTEATLKTSHWSRLPWLLCALASTDSQRARDSAQQCLRLFDETVEAADSQMKEWVLSQHHPLTKRFLQKDFGHGAGAEDRWLLVAIGYRWFFEI